MLKIIMSVSAKAAAQYYDSALEKTNYYAKEVGVWGGVAAPQLGLEGEVQRKDFLALARNEWPGKGTTLTVRQKAKRRCGYDVCFAVPKSVSVYMALSGDRAVERMIQEAFRETMADIERAMETRVRVNGEDRTRTTGNMVYAAFVHTVSRPVDGIVDPHYHIHAFTFNATYDRVEQRWKAIELGKVKADAPFYEAAFNGRLAQKLINAGYGVRRTDYHFELASVSRELVEKFSRRTREIEQIAKEKYTVIEAEARQLARRTGMAFEDAFAQVKSELGKRSRDNKAEVILDEKGQLANWRAQLTTEEAESLKTVNVKGAVNRHLLEKGNAESLAIDHLFERKSVARELHAAGLLLRRGLGGVSVRDAVDFARTDPRFTRAVGNGHLITTREAMQQEVDVLKLIEAGRGQFESIGRGKSWVAIGSEEQAKAVQHILDSKDLVTSVRGVAGSGKTTMLKEAVRALTDAGQDVLAFAPSSSATSNLDFARSHTVQKLLVDPAVQDLARGKVLLVDEAGFLSVREMLQVVSFAAKNNCRVILSGDSRQHHSVERGDALRILEDSSSITQAALNKIFRQQMPALREAIEDLSQGRTRNGFDKLDHLGVIREMADVEDRLKAICDLYLTARENKHSTLIVAPTHGEARRISEAIRKELRKRGLIGEGERMCTRLENLNLTQAQREDSIHYEKGQIIEFHRHVSGGFKSGEQWAVAGTSGRKEIVVQRGVEQRFLPLAQAGKFSVYKPRPVGFSVGDVVRITKSGSGFLNNELRTITRIYVDKVVFDKGELKTARAIHLDQGLVVTSHASQGKTVSQVIVSAPVESFSQVNQAQFYVSMSRARYGMHIFTDSKAALREAVNRKSARIGASELVTKLSQRTRGNSFILEEMKQPDRTREIER